MYRVTREAHFSAAHHLRRYNGKCEHQHGHNWRVEVTAQGHTLNEGGMLIDFGELKVALKEVLDRLDHQDLNLVPPFDVQEPSAENIARYILEEVGKLIQTEGVEIAEVNVWETPGSKATYLPDPV